MGLRAIRLLAASMMRSAKAKTMLMTVPVTIHIAAGLFWLTSMFASNVLKTGRHRLLVSDCVT